MDASSASRKRPLPSDGDALRSQLRAILEVPMPGSWFGTTFDNSTVHGRAGFAQRLLSLCTSGHDAISTQQLLDLGSPEDYMRVATHVSTILEVALSVEKGLRDTSCCCSFASSRMPIVAVLFASSRAGRVHLYYGQARPPFTSAQERLLSSVSGASLVLHAGAPAAQVDGITLCLDSAVEAASYEHLCVDGVISTGIIGGVLYIVNCRKISPSAPMPIAPRPNQHLPTNTS